MCHFASIGDIAYSVTFLALFYTIKTICIIIITVGYCITFVNKFSFYFNGYL